MLVLQMGVAQYTVQVWQADIALNHHAFYTVVAFMRFGHLTATQRAKHVFRRHLQFPISRCWARGPGPLHLIGLHVQIKGVEDIEGRLPC